MIFLRTIQLFQIIGAMLVGAIISSQTQMIHELKVKAAVEEAESRMLLSMSLRSLTEISMNDL